MAVTLDPTSVVVRSEPQAVASPPASAPSAQSADGMDAARPRAPSLRTSAPLDAAFAASAGQAPRATELISEFKKVVDSLDLKFADMSAKGPFAAVLSRAQKLPEADLLEFTRVAASLLHADNIEVLAHGSNSPAYDKVLVRMSTEGALINYRERGDSPSKLALSCPTVMPENMGNVEAWSATMSAAVKEDGELKKKLAQVTPKSLLEALLAEAKEKPDEGTKKVLAAECLARHDALRRALE